MSPQGRSPLHEAQAASGAVFSEHGGASRVSSYGDLAAEYDAALDGAGLVDLAERGVLTASGPKRLAFLHGMLSNEVDGRAPGEGCRAALMTAKGRLRYLLRVLVEEDRVRIETDADRLQLLLEDLERYRVAAPVRFAVESVAVLAILGMRGAEVLKDRGLEPPGSPEAHCRGQLAGHDVVVARAGDLPGGGFVLHTTPAHAEAAWNTLKDAGARPVGRDALDARRVEDLRPWYGFDITEDNILHETGLLGELHSSTKGCYVGQEVVARLEARGGHVNKGLRRLRLGKPAAAGSPVLVGEKEVGRVSTAAVSPRFGPVALAWIHRNHLEPGTVVDVGGAAATVIQGFDQE